ncbi:MAG: hypothetical protein ACRELE_05755 [Gemmatimonadales bacterium]
MRRPLLVTVLVGLVVVGAATARAIRSNVNIGPLRARSAALAIEWRGKYPGRMVLPAQLNWCPVTRVGVLEAVSGDSGVAIVLFEHEALTAATHPVFSHEFAATAPRPAATAAVRWMRLAKDTALAGFRSLSGAVKVQLAPGKISGDINARMQSVAGFDTLVVRGIFRDVPVVTTSIGCS